MHRYTGPHPGPSFASQFGHLIPRKPKPVKVKKQPLAKQPHLSFARSRAVKPVAPNRPHTGPVVASHAPPHPVRFTSVPRGHSSPPRPASSRPVPRRSSPPPVQAGPAAASDPAQTYIDASLAPLLQQLHDQQQVDLSQESQRRANLNAATAQWLKLIAGVPGDVEADYGAGIQQQQQMGAEALAAMNAANPNAQTQADLQAIGAPQAQQQAVANQNQQTFAGGGALLKYNAALQGQYLSRNQMAELAWARGLPTVATDAAFQATTKLNQAATSAQRARDAKLAEIMAGVPKLRLDYQAQQQAARQKNDYLNFLQGKFGVQTKQANARLRQGNVRIRASAANAANNANLRYAEVYGYNPRTGQPTLAALKAAKADKAKGNKPPSATALNAWNQYAEDAYHGVAPKTRYDAASGTFKPIPGTGKQAVAYYQALKRLMAMGATLPQAQKVLNVLYGKGEGGRPYVSLQGRIALQKAGMPLGGTNATPNARQKAYLQARGLWSD